MAKSDNLRKAKEEKNDEFYTQLSDIVAEIAQHPDYVKHFKDKTVLCNCDDPEWSAFVEFFRLFFNKLGIKKMISTHYTKDGSPSYKLEWSGEKLNGDTINMIKTPLKGDGDFRSEECIELLKEADIVVTNPPFSKAREYMATLMKYHKQFIVIGDLNWITYKEIFPWLKDNEIWLGYGHVKEFRQPDGTMKKFGNKLWFTNLDIDKIHEPLTLTKLYKGNEDHYPKYDNYDAIEVGKVSEIPKDYEGLMGVPVTFMNNYDASQFKILGMLQSSTDEQAGTPNLRYYNDFKEMRQDMTYTGASGGKANGNPVVKGKSAHGNFLYNPETHEYVHSVYARIVIQRKAS